MRDLTKRQEYRFFFQSLSIEIWSELRHSEVIKEKAKSKKNQYFETFLVLKKAKFRESFVKKKRVWKTHITVRFDENFARPGLHGFEELLKVSKKHSNKSQFCDSNFLDRLNYYDLISFIWNRNNLFVA